MTPSDERWANIMQRRGGGSWIGSDGMQWTTQGPNQIELLHDIRDLLGQILSVMKSEHHLAKPPPDLWTRQQHQRLASLAMNLDTVGVTGSIPVAPTIRNMTGTTAPMPHLHYRVVPHDGGWAYTLGGAFSEPFTSRERALQAAQVAAAEQRIPDDTVLIEYQDEAGAWHTELSCGDDRPDADVVA